MSLTPADLLVAVPTRGAVDWNTVRVLQDLRDRHSDLAPILYEPGRMSVTDTRNRIVQTFLRSDKKCLLMVDDDVIPDLNVLNVLNDMKDAPSGAGYDIIGCPYLMVRAPLTILTPCVFSRAERGLVPLKDVLYLRGLHDCDVVGTGCMFVARHVLEDTDLLPFVLDTDEYGVLIRTEDVMFCLAAREKGYRIGAHFDYAADHWQSVSSNALHAGYMKTWTKALQRDRERRPTPLVTLAR